MSKQELESIQARIESDYGEDSTFFFGEHAGVVGYHGMGDVVFAAQKPSTGGGREFPSTHVKYFYSKLKEYGLEDAHLTDVSKIKGKAGPIEPNEAVEMIPYLLDELQAVDPTLVVAVGNRAQRFVMTMCALFDYEYATIPHYSYASRFGHKEEFDEAISAIADDIHQ